MSTTLRQNISVEVIHGDIMEYPAEVLALKFAQDLYGADLAVVRRLKQHGIDVRDRLPKIGETITVSSDGAIAAGTILFIGVKPLGSFGYRQIREFGEQALSAMTDSLPNTEHVAVTLHGRGFGLDEAEAFKSEIAGFVDALFKGTYPRSLRLVSVVERDAKSVKRLSALLSTIMPFGEFRPGGDAHSESNGMTTRAILGTVGYESQKKPHVFVAMPFGDEYLDRFHYGIRSAINAAGYLCERADSATFTGDVLKWIKERIDSATLVVADLSSANPNVYLEVAYAWGRGVETVLLVSNSTDLKFDTRGQRCLVYNNIRHLEELLISELNALKGQSAS